MKTFLLVAAVVFGFFFYTHFEKITASKERAAKVTELRALLWSANQENSTPDEIFQLVEELRFYIRDQGLVTSQDLGMSDEYEIKDWIGRLSLIGKMKQVAEDEKWIVALWQKHNEAKTRPTKEELQEVDVRLKGIDKNLKVFWEKKGAVSFSLSPIKGDGRSMFFNIGHVPITPEKAMVYAKALREGTVPKVAR